MYLSPELFVPEDTDPHPSAACAFHAELSHNLPEESFPSPQTMRQLLTLDPIARFSSLRQSRIHSLFAKTLYQPQQEMLDRAGILEGQRSSFDDFGLPSAVERGVAIARSLHLHATALSVGTL